jgi:hypothetical protein
MMKRNYDYIVNRRKVRTVSITVSNRFSSRLKLDFKSIGRRTNETNAENQRPLYTKFIRLDSVLKMIGK